MRDKSLIEDFKGIISDSNMKTVLENQFKCAINSGQDELDFYIALLGIGITVGMVREYLGDDAADCMQQFCEEHGLI